MGKFTEAFSEHRFLLAIDKVQYNLEKIFLSLGMIFVATLLGLTIILNSLFNISLYWATELSQYVIVWVIFIGTSTLIRRSEHVNLDILLDTLSEKSRNLLQLIIYIFTFIVILYFVYIGWTMTLEIFSKGQTGSNFKISMGWVYLSFPIGMMLAAINSIKIIMLKIKEIKGG